MTSDIPGDQLQPRPAAASSDPDELDLERRIVEAELAGRRTVADVLARELEARRAARADVIDLARERQRRRVD